MKNKINLIRLGNHLEKLCTHAQDEVLLAAPFIKASTLKFLLKAIPSHVPLRCITRWKPEEIIAGVSDLEVWNLMKERSHSSLWLRADLHAKYYRVDHQCLVGSANLTAKALGWSSSPNLELLVFLSAREPPLEAFEAELCRGAIPVDESLFKQISATVQLLKQELLPSTILTATQVCHSSDIYPEAPTIKSIPPEIWLPTLRNPQDLYLAYSGQQEKLTTAARQAAIQDLYSLPVIPNLSQKSFKAYIGTLLLQQTLIRQVDTFVENPQRFGAVRDFLASLPCATHPDFNANRAWQTLMRWLLYFLPDRYALSVPRHSEIFYRIPIDN